MLGMKVLGPDGASFELREDPDGLLCTVLDGDLSEDMAHALAAACLHVVESGREVLLLCDARRAGALPPAVRKVLADEMRSVRLVGVAVVGASFAMRVVATLTAKSIELLSGQLYPVKFLATEAEGRAWLLTQREALRAKRGPVA
ncbi:STAS/SEC14 domain-containing protein [Sorangium sp. So ce131]|uniref:STAS/SEC14 domain-containing protein n=1 Tax=Sorangium sp. So ce131 TaxID=3133282 RepID=UPI003F637916